MNKEKGMKCPDCDSTPTDNQKPIAGFDLKRQEDCDIIACLNPGCKRLYYKVNLDN